MLLIFLLIQGKCYHPTLSMDTLVMKKVINSAKPNIVAARRRKQK